MIHKIIESRFLRREICFHRRNFRHGIPLQDSVPFPKQHGDRIQNAGSVVSVNHLHARISVFVLADVHETAARDASTQNRAVRQDIPAVHVENLIDPEIVFRELGEYQSIRQRINGR